MKVIINVLPFIGALTASFISYSIMQGTAQEVVHFAGVLNEIAVFMMTSLMAIGLLVMSFERAPKTVINK
jgi:hypothetical protein